MLHIKEKIIKMLPSYRAKNALIEKLEVIQNELGDIKRSIEDHDYKNDYLFFASQLHNYEDYNEMRKTFFLTLPPASGKLRELQLAENFILQRVKDICDANEIQFFLVAGTLLGAIRHHGFIPWDDDIDIGMMEQDCEKLKKYLSNDEYIEMKQYYLKSGSMVYKVKFRFSESVFIDVFPYVYMNCDENKLEARWKETQELTIKYCEEIRLLLQKYININSFSGFPVAFAEMDQEVDALYKYFDEQYMHVGNLKYLTRSIKCGVAFRTNDEILPIEEALPLLKNAVVFEGKKYDILKGSMRLLMQGYGDIWTFPSSLTPTHMCELEDLDNCLDKLKEIQLIGETEYKI